MKKISLAALCAAVAMYAQAETCTATNIVVAPLPDAHWTQGAPYNDYSPKGTTVFTSGWEAGCVAIAAAQELRYWQWPWRLDAVHETSHIVLNEDNLALRFDGNVPFDWENMPASFAGGETLAEKHAVAHLVLACQSLVQMRFVSGGGEAMKNLPGTMEWYEYMGQVTPRASDANLAALRADFEFGSPVQTGINFKGYGGHEVVGLGYATGTNSVGEAKNLIWLNLGWGGGSDGWYDVGETSESETIIKATQLGFRPIKSVQIEPLAPVSGSSVTIDWHLPNCYTNKVSGFTVAKKKLNAATATWSDDFSTAKGRSNNTNEVRIVNGALKAWDGTASGIYTWEEVFVPTAESVMTYDSGSSYMSGMSVRFEAKVDGVWQCFHTVAVNGGKEANYYNWGTTTPAEPVSLASLAGKKIQLRFVVEYTTGGIFTSDDASLKIDNLSISNVKTFETFATDSTIAATARSATFGGLDDGETYAFSVTPIMSDGSAAVTQTATTTIGTPAAPPTINAVSMTLKDVDLVEEGFYADIAMGWNVIDVACSESVTSLEAFISHQSVLPQSKIEVVDNGSGSFSINIDATEVAAKWANQKMILTLKATNATGESTYKDVEFCLKAPVRSPEPTAVWLAGEFKDAASKHGGYSIVLPDSGMSISDGKLVVASDATIGATIDLSSANANKVTVLIEYSALAAVSGKNVALATVKDSESHVIGARTTANGALTLTGYYDAGSDNDYAFGTVPTVASGAGYLMLTYDNTTDNNINGVYCYAGSTIATLAGGRNSTLKWTGNSRKINEVSIGGPSTANRVKAWPGVKIEMVALFVGEALTDSDVANYEFPEPEEPEFPGINTNVAMSVGDFTLDSTGEWAEIVDTPIYLTLASPVKRFKISFDACIPAGCGTLFSWDSTNANETVDSRVVMTNDASKMVIWRKNDGTLSTVGYNESALIASGQHHIAVLWVHNGGCTIYVDGEACYSSENLKFSNHDTSMFALGGSALGSPDDVLSGLKVKNFTYNVYTDQVTLLDGTIYHGNDANRLVITNYLSQMVGSRPVKMPAPNTVDLLLVYDPNAATYATNHYATVEEHAARNVAEMNRALTTTDIDTNVWFRIAGIYQVDVAAAHVDDALAKLNSGTAEGWDRVNAERDRVGADVVLGVVYTNSNYGLANWCSPSEIMNGNGANYAFAGVRADAAWSWVHEVGHTASLYHNPGEAANSYNNRTSIGCGFVKTAEADMAELRSLMNSGTAQMAFSSPNHMSHGEIYSVTNASGQYVDSSYELARLLPYMANYRDTKVNAWSVTPQSGSTVMAGDTMTVTCEDPDATIWYSRYGEDDVQYDGPVAIDTSSSYCIYVVTVKKAGETVATTMVAYMVDQTQADAAAKIDGGAGFKTLQAAIDAAESGATIVLLKSSSEAITLNKTILFSEGESATFSGTFTGSGTLKLGAFLKNSKTQSGVSPLAAGWTGTVELMFAFEASGFATPIARYGNANSTLRLTGGMTGGWLANVALDTTIELVGDMAISDFSTSFANTIKKLTGTGTFSVTYSSSPDLQYPGYYPYYLIKDVGDFKGSLAVPENGTIGIVVGASSKPSDKTHGGKILVYTPVTASANWTASNGIVLADATATLTVVDGAAITTSPAISTTVADSYVKATAVAGGTQYAVRLLADRITDTDYPVPYSWLELYIPEIAGYPDAMYDTVAKSPGENGYSYWESYVLGLDPTNATSKFTTTIRMNGTTPIVEYFPTNETLKASGTIEYILQGKPSLKNDWQDVEFAEPGDTNRFFRVKVTW